MKLTIRMFKVLRRLARWDDARLRKLEKLLDASEGDAAADLLGTITGEAFDRKLKQALAAGSLNGVMDRVLKHRAEERSKALMAKCTSSGATFLPEARIENLAGDPSRIVVGEGTYVRAELLVFRFGGQLTIGDHCYVGENSRVWAGERMTIGNHVLISHDVFITDCNAHELDADERAAGFQKLVSEGHPTTKGSVLTSPVTIGDHAWINPRCTVLPGVTIGKGAIIGAGSVVNQDVPPFVLAAGSPARVIRELPQPAVS